MNKNSFRQTLINAGKLFVLCILFVASNFGQQYKQPENSLETLFEKFKIETKAPCGRRAEAIRIGKRIVELYANDEFNGEVIQYVEKETARIEKDDKACNRKPFDYGNRKDLIEISKKIIAEEGDSLLALDVMLTLVSVGYELFVVEKDATYNKDTIVYAKLAIQKIEAGQTSKSWGVIEPLKTKENALAWMNYIIGYIYSRRNQKAEALPYFYKAIQLKSDLKKDAEIYQFIGNYYFDQIKQLTKNGTKPPDFRVKGYADRALIAFGKAYRSAVDNKSGKELTNSLHNQLNELYKLRFNLQQNIKPEILKDFISKLSNQTLPDFTAPLEPVFD